MRRLSVVVAAFVIVLAGCRAESSTGANEEANDSPRSGSTPSSQAAVGETFGDLASPCGPGDAKGATDQGVTDTAIKIGTMSDASAQLQPGLNQELWDSSKAFVEWCNGQGGILGRQIEYTQFEPKLLEAQQAAIDACATEFMLVGGGAAFDADVARERVACGLPDVPAYNATKEAIEAPLSYPVLPTPFDELPAGEAFYLADQYPDAVAKSGMLAPNFPTAVNIAKRAQAAYEGAGWTFVDQQLYNPAGEANWTGIVTGFKTNGVEAIVYAGTMEPMAAFLQAAAEQDYHPQITIGSSTIYTPDLVTEAGAAAEGTYSYTNIVPLDEDNAAIQKYTQLIDQYADGATPALLGINSMSAWLLWATAAKECGSDLTRTCIGDKIGAVHEWTAGGLHAASDPGNRRSPSCFVLVQVKDGKWVRVHPEQGFDCDDSYFVDTSGVDYE